MLSVADSGTREGLETWCTYMLRGLRDKNLLLSLEQGSRKYVINLKARFLRLGIMEALDQNGFLPPQLPANN